VKIEDSPEEAPVKKLRASDKEANESSNNNRKLQAPPETAKRENNEPIIQVAKNTKNSIKSSREV
jgi:hypothetical protein